MAALKVDAGHSLRRALRRHLRAFRCESSLEEVVSESWASVTFTGARHRFRLRLTGPAARAEADRFLATLAEEEFELGRHLLADICLLCDQSLDGEEDILLMLEALTVENG